MEALLELNKQGLHTRLAKVQHIKDLYVASDLIDILSNQKERDRRIINDYSEDELKTYKIQRLGGLKTVRMLTKKGIERYLHEGKLFDYNNACSYFSVIPIDKVKQGYLADLESFLSDTNTTKKDNVKKDNVKKDTIKKYDTKKLLKWLFGKRKMCKALGDQTSIAEVLEIFGASEDADQSKLEFLKNKANPL